VSSDLSESQKALINRIAAEAVNDYYVKKGEVPIITEDAGSFRKDEYVAPNELGIPGITITVDKRR
jgi:hypothetical protein